jgi:hypothetical protein
MRARNVIGRHSIVDDQKRDIVRRKWAPAMEKVLDGDEYGGLSCRSLRSDSNIFV